MKTILVADDEEDLRTIVHMTLEDPQYRILEAADGNSVLQLVQQERPDLLILDWMMPGKTGLEVIKILRDISVAQHLPVILLTANDSSPDLAELETLGMFAYLKKPFSPLQLLKQVQTALG